VTKWAGLGVSCGCQVEGLSGMLVNAFTIPNSLPALPWRAISLLGFTLAKELFLDKIAGLGSSPVVAGSVQQCSAHVQRTRFGA